MVALIVAAQQLTDYDATIGGALSKHKDVETLRAAVMNGARKFIIKREERKITVTARKLVGGAQYDTVVTVAERTRKNKS